MLVGNTRTTVASTILHGGLPDLWNDSFSGMVAESTHPVSLLDNQWTLTI